VAWTRSPNRARACQVASGDWSGGVGPGTGAGGQGSGVILRSRIDPCREGMGSSSIERERPTPRWNRESKGWNSHSCKDEGMRVLPHAFIAEKVMSAAVHPFISQSAAGPAERRSTQLRVPCALLLSSSDLVRAAYGRVCPSCHR